MERTRWEESVGMLKNAREEEQVELIKLVEEVWDAGIVVVAAEAGNNGPAGNSVTIPESVGRSLR